MRTGWSCSCICQLHALCCYASISPLSTDFPCELVHNFVLINVFCFDFGSFFLFIMLNRVWWLAKLDWTFHECSLLCWRYLVEGGFELLSGLSSSEGLKLKHVERTHRGGTSQTPLSSWGALPTPREPATQAVRDGRDRPASILILVMCCMLRWMLLGGRVGLGIVTCPLWRSASSLACLFSLLTCFHKPPCSRTTCLLDIAWLGNLAGQGAVPVAGVHISCMGTYMVTLAVLLTLHGDTHVS